MGRKIERLTLDNLDSLPTRCRACLFWELDAVRRARVPEDRAAAEKEAWVRSVLAEWGSCGRVATIDGAAVGYVLYAPAAFVPGADAFPTAPASPDAVLLTTAYVDPAARRGGIGRMLIQSMAADLVKRGGVNAVEAFGDTRGSRVTEGHCVVPAEFLDRVGFTTQRAHSTSPRMRMELRTTLTWKNEVELAVERLLGAVRPAPKAHRPPAGFQSRMSKKPLSR